MGDVGYIWTPKDALSDYQYMRILRISNRIESYSVLGMIRHLLDIQWIEGCLPLEIEALCNLLFLDVGLELGEASKSIKGDSCVSKIGGSRKKRKKKSSYALSKNNNLETSDAVYVFLKYKNIFTEFFPPCARCGGYRINPKLDRVKEALMEKIEKRRAAANVRWGKQLAGGKKSTLKRCKCFEDPELIRRD